MTWRIRNDEFPSCGGEVAVGNVDRDALFALGAQTVGQQREVDRSGGAVDAAVFHGSQLIFVNAFGVMQQPANQRGFAVVHAARGGKPQQFLLQDPAEEKGRILVEQRSGQTSEIALPFFQFHRAFFIVIDGAVFAFRAAERNHLLDNFGKGIGFGADRAGARHATQGAHPALHQFRFFAGQEFLFGVNQHERAVRGPRFRVARA